MTTLLDRLLPATVDRRVRGAAVASLIAEILIVGTGAAVRLTGSGLGCPTWPRCTADSFATTPAMGAHGLIEFGNRLLTFALVVVAITTLAAVWRLRRRRADLFGLAVAQIASIPAQAVIGGITVWTGLNPWTVAAHFVVSIGLVVLMTVLVHRTRTAPGPRALAVPRAVAGLGAATGALTAVVVVLGIVTTGAGPHAGDAASARNGLNAVAVAGVHEAAAWVLLATTIVLVAASALRRLPTLRPAVLLLAVEAVQIAVGLTQVALGWNAGFVVVHVLLAACLASASTNAVLHLRAPAEARVRREPVAA